MNPPRGPLRAVVGPTALKIAFDGVTNDPLCNVNSCGLTGGCAAEFGMTCEWTLPY